MIILVSFVVVFRTRETRKKNTVQRSYQNLLTLYKKKEKLTKIQKCQIVTPVVLLRCFFTICWRWKRCNKTSFLALVWTYQRCDKVGRRKKEAKYLKFCNILLITMWGHIKIFLVTILHAFWPPKRAKIGNGNKNVY